MGHEMVSDFWLWRWQLIPALVFLPGCRWFSPCFPQKPQHFGCQVLLQRWGTESTESCWRLEVVVVCCAWGLGKLSLCLSIRPGWCHGVRQLQVLSREDVSHGQICISVLQPFAQVHSKWQQTVFSLQTRTVVAKSLNKSKPLDSQLGSACLRMLPCKSACPQHPSLMKKSPFSWLKLRFIFFIFLIEVYFPL